MINCFMIMLKVTIINAYAIQISMISIEIDIMNEFFIFLPFVYSAYQIIDLTISRIYCIIADVHEAQI